MSEYPYSDLTEDFVMESSKILGDELVGIYLHGSAVMGCFNPKKSDIDLIVVVRDSVDDDSKRRLMKMIVALNCIFLRVLWGGIIPTPKAISVT